MLVRSPADVGERVTRRADEARWRGLARCLQRIPEECLDLLPLRRVAHVLARHQRRPGGDVDDGDAGVAEHRHAVPHHARVRDELVE